MAAREGVGRLARFGVGLTVGALAELKFVDIDLQTLNYDLEQLDAAVTPQCQYLGARIKTNYRKPR